MSTAPATPTQPTFNPRQLMDLYVQGQYDQLSEKFIETLRYFHGMTLAGVDRPAQYFINAFAKTFLTLFTQPDYLLGDAHVEPFIRLNLTISNLVALSALKNTDAFLEILRDQPANLVKILTLCSARNTVVFDRQALIEAEPALVSLWYSVYAHIFRTGLVRPEVCANLQEHFRFRHPKLKPNYEVQEIYFGSTYVDGQSDRVIKPVVNEAVHEVVRPVAERVVRTPDPRKIAVLSGCWFRPHPVYRGCYGYLRALKEQYHLTFFRLGAVKPDEDLSVFDEVRSLESRGGTLDLTPLMQSDFQVAYFPDIGMNQDSIVLANMRLAPVQVASPGHSVSTWGAAIDYWISGDKVETPDEPERNYSERLVLIPGLGLMHRRPTIERTGRRKTMPQFLINCSWHAHKVNYRFCRTMQELIRSATKPVRLRVFVGASLIRQNDFLPFVRDLTELLGPEHVEVITGRVYPEYMALMEEGDITIDSYHFGGCNTVADSLFVGKPMVTWEGDKWYNRIGAAMLRLAGLDELIATTEEQYLDLVLRLIHDDDYRDALTERVLQADLDNTIFSTTEAVSFRKAIDYLIANHDRIQREGGRTPIRIAP